MIETVLGPIPASRLGPTSMHEHVLSDARGLAPEDDYALRDPKLATTELARAGAAGQRTVVDPTGWGFGGPAPELPAVSRAAGVQIVAGVGAYLGRTRPPWLTDLGTDALTGRFLNALVDNLPGCDHRAGIVGIIAPDHPLAAHDERILAAAAQAAAQTGSALMLRLDPRYDDGPMLIERLAQAGLTADRIVLSNIDGYAAQPESLDRLAATGATLKWCFGYEAPPRAALRSATDTERADALCDLLERGVTRQVLACGVWTRSALHAQGGFGYDHLMTRVVPALRDRGLDEASLARLLVDEPARLLDRRAPPVTAARGTPAAPSQRPRRDSAPPPSA